MSTPQVCVVRSFPALGFDPAPGDVSAIDSLVQVLETAIGFLGDGYTQLTNINSKTGSDWEGKAADSYRQHANTDLPPAMKNAHDSFVKAHDALKGWASDLTEFQKSADTLEQEAVTAKANLAAANQHLSDVNANPYHVVGKDPTGELAKQAAAKQSQAVSAANTGITDAQNALNDVINRAKKLLGEHDDTASRAAKSLKSAPDNLAPHKPGLLSDIGHFLESSAGVLSDISAVAGFVALLTPPPFDAIAFTVAVGTGALAAIGHGMEGDWKDMAFDLVGAVPGIGELGDALKGAKAADTMVAGAKLVGDAAKAGDVADMADAAKLTVSSGVTDTLGKVSESLEETKVLGTNLSRLAINGLNKVPGVAIGDTLGAAANLNKVVAGIGAAGGVADLGTTAFGGSVPGAASDGNGWGQAVYGTATTVLDKMVDAGKVAVVQ